MLHVVCLKAGKAYGPDYVNILHDMVTRNLPAGFPGRFACITDDPSGLDPGIAIIFLPEGLEGWWGKLWMFSGEAFKPGDRVLFFDLDTLILGPLDDIAAYDGDFAILRDFYRPNGYGSAVMGWRVGSGEEVIWTSWVAAEKPIVSGGDQAWIERQIARADLWQDLFPRKFVSYKADGCQSGAPRGASVLCFHGQPKPDNCDAEWVPFIWRVGGGSTAMLEQVCNTKAERLLDHVRSSVLRDLPWLDIAPVHEKEAWIIGGGPSLTETIDIIPPGADVFALNAAASYLLERGIPCRQVILDARDDMAAMVDHRAQSYFLASQCAPAVYGRAGKAATVYHPNIVGIVQILEGNAKPVHLIGGGSTVGLQTLVIAYALGYRTIHLLGMDSSYREEAGHAYAQPLNDGERRIEVTVAGEKFSAAPWMAQQADEFQSVAAELANMGCAIHVYGDGLLPAVAREMGRQHANAESFAASPPSVERLPPGLIFLPSRGRPHLLQRFFDSSQPKLPGIVLLEDDDAPNYANLCLPEGWRIEITPKEDFGVIKRINDAWARHPGLAWYGVATDDCEALTPDWDSHLAQACLGGNLAWGNDGLPHSDGIGALFFVSGDLASAVGWLLCSEFKHFYGDTAWRSLVDPLGRARYMPEITAPHRHFSGGAPFDQTYAERPPADHDAWEKWQACELPRLLDRLSLRAAA